MQKVMYKKGLKDFINNLMSKYEVVGPVRGKVRGAGKKEDESRGVPVTRFSVIRDYSELWLDGITLVPLKQIFMPEGETLFEFSGGKIIKPKLDQKKRIIFGMRKCDLNALLILDKVMTDSLYRSKRENTILIGMHCENPDKYCFCNSMELVDYYDLFFYPEGDKYYISVGSKKGAEIVKNLRNADREVKKEIKNFKSLKRKDIEKDYNNKLWKKDVEKCLSCAACTIYCPTCNCFDIYDAQDLDLKGGRRARKQASCQLKSFTEVAGGKSFRETRDSRFKHFVYHKVVYYKKRFNRYMCVGCGRCLRVCPTRIDWVGTINSIKEGKNGV